MPNVYQDPMIDAIAQKFENLVAGMRSIASASDAAKWQAMVVQAFPDTSSSQYTHLMGMFKQQYPQYANLPLATGEPVGGTPPAGGGTPPAGGGANGNAPTSEVYSPFTAYMNAMGLGGKNYLNPAQRYQAAQAEPTESLWNIQSALAARPGSSVYMPGGFEEYMGTVAQPGSIGTRAGQLLKTLFGETPEQRTQDFSYEPTYDATTGQYGSGNIGDLQDLVGMAMRGRLAPSAVQYMRGQLPRQQQVWQQQQAAGGNQTAFLDWLRNQYGNVFNRMT